MSPSTTNREQAVGSIRPDFLSPIYSRLASGAFWSLIASALGQGAPLLAGIVTARLLGKEVFGALSMVQSTAVMLGALVAAGFSMAATKYIAELRCTDIVRAGRVATLTLTDTLASGVAIASLACLFAPALAHRISADPALIEPLRISGGLLLGTALGSVQIGVFTGLESFRIAAVLSGIRGIVTVLMCVGGAWLGGLTGAVWGQSLSSLLSCVLNQVALAKICANSGLPLSGVRTCWDDRAILWRFSVPAVLANAMVVPITWLATTWIVDLPGGLGQIGAFSAANQWRMGCLFVPSIISQTFLPVFTSTRAKSAVDADKLMWVSLVCVTTISALLALAISVFSSPILGLYGGQFQDGTLTLRMLVASTIPAAASAVIGQLLAGTGKLWIGFGMNAIWGVVFLGLARHGRYDGATGLAAAFLISYAVHALITISYVLTTVKKAEPSPASASTRRRLLYLMHVDWRWIKQRPQFIAEHLVSVCDVHVVHRLTPGRRHYGQPSAPEPPRLPLLPIPWSWRGIRWATIPLHRMWLDIISLFVMPDIVWITHPALFEALPARLNSRPVVYDCMDDALAFKASDSRINLLKKLERELVTRASAILVSSSRLAEVIVERYGLEFRGKITIVRNAICPSMLERLATLEVQLPHPRDGRCLKVAYIGTIADWFDFDLLIRALDECEELEFHLIGPVSIRNRPRHDRLKYHGPVSHWKLPEFCAHFDAFIMPFRLNALTGAVDPVKVYEYLAFGKEVLLPRYPEIARFADYIHFYETPEDFSGLLTCLMERRIQLKNTIARSHTFLAGNTWQNRLDQIAPLLASL
jgi:O-antigen/teichoic acid export membrane protein/glycosyltransferase involved in cell wall biosynthesis